MPENYVLLERTELNASAASVTFANIPQSGYTDLKIVMSLRSTVGGGTNWDPLLYRFNSSTSGYSTKEVEGTGSAAASSSATTATSTAAGGTWGRLQDYGITTSNQTANTFSNIEFYIPNYTSSNQKSGSFDSVYETNATAAYAEMVATLHTGTSAITTLDFALKDGSFAQYSTFSLYGIAAVGTTPAIAPKASGGNRIDNDGTYWYHTFTSSGTFTPQTGLSCDVLVVAGGGAGGGAYGGGGGAGGFRVLTSQSLASSVGYTVAIGAGGTGGTGSYPSGTRGGSGVNSSISGTGFTTITSSGGGGGGTHNTANAGASGGSGGGSSIVNTGGAGNAGGYSPVEGYAGFSSVVNTEMGGGGGAAGAATGRNGANGSVAYSSWATATSTGVSGYYAGGGGAGRGSTGTGGGGTGGSGGGGAGQSTFGAGTNGTTNTGGGGGGGGEDYGGTGAAGGSGLVIIRYAI